jgi:acetyl-CoA carboxylase biotin carboxyl carrier protein
MAAKRKSVRTDVPAAPATRGGGAQGATTSLDVATLREIVQLLEASEVTRLSWQRGDERLEIRRGPPVGQTTVFHAAAAPLGMPLAGAGALLPQAAAAPVAAAPPAPPAAPPPAAAAAAPAAAPAPAPAASPARGGQLVTSPFVGTFYRSPGPDQPPFVEVGTVVKKGQVLCIVEAMKLMNEIEAEVAGKVTEVLVENAQAVEFGQALFRIESA